MKQLFTFIILAYMTTSCNNPTPPAVNADTAKKGSFGYDLAFLRQHDSVVVLESGNGRSRIIVSPKYQAKVFTSTADGDSGLSFGWVNYKAFSAPLDSHMNAYGGENRLWLGPEGGKFSLYFKPGTKMEFANWHTPAAFDTEVWKVSKQSSSSISLQKDMQLVNYAGTELALSVDRTITMLDDAAIASNIGGSVGSDVKVVGYETLNTLTNTGKQEWTEATGMPCIWMLDMLKTTPATVIVTPYKNAAGKKFDEVATTNYFGEIPADRLKHDDDRLFLKADGKSRGKLGIKPGYAKNVLGSYDPENRVLTVTMFVPDPSAKYLNQEWNTTKPPFSGDAVNAYNDGPLADGSQMGPFYEIESVSPAAFLKPDGSLAHRHTVYHFTGEEKSLDTIAHTLLGVSLNDIKKAFNQ